MCLLFKRILLLPIESFTPDYAKCWDMFIAIPSFIECKALIENLLYWTYKRKNFIKHLFPKELNHSKESFFGQAQMKFDENKEENTAWMFTQMTQDTYSPELIEEF